ncbi:MAG: hypothetical protein CM1200mP29_04970 [Verrucomicrobiota bacterium]|nr:MAG: hypothetical protein CM1200mP29_04970 [Verrucomicrobiota bacterium]
MALADKGVELKLLEPSKPGRIEPEDVFALIDSRTRMGAPLASCHYVSGYRIDIDAIGRELRSRDVLFCVDGIQTMGVFPTPVEHVDFLAADAHKWMLGPCASGILYVKREAQERLKPVVQGWHNLSCPDFIAQERLDYKPDSRRYEAGTANLLGIVGHHASLKMLNAVGLDNIADDLLAKRRRLVPGSWPRAMRECTPTRLRLIPAASSPSANRARTWGARGNNLAKRALRFRCG